METIHDLPGWGNANSREMHVRKEAIEWVNSEQRSATKFTTRSVAEGECIASNERQSAVVIREKMNKIPKCCFGRDDWWRPFEACVLRT